MAPGEGATTLPRLIINANTCVEGPTGFDNGTVEVNAPLKILGNRHLASQCFETGGIEECVSNGDTVIDVAPGVGDQRLSNPR